MKTNSSSMRRAALAVAFLAAAWAPLAVAQTSKAAGERWLHVRIESEDNKGELVRVNVPLELAEKVLPAIHNERLHNGRVTIDSANVHGVDLHAVLEAVRSSRDGEFVTVQSNHGDVRVMKQAGYLLVHVRDDKYDGQHRVEVRVPMTVVDALLSSGSNELDLVAAVRALAQHGDTELVTVKDHKNTVRVWLDSKNTSQ